MDTGRATWPGTVDDAGTLLAAIVVGLDEDPELPPQAASVETANTESDTSRRVRTTRIVPILPESPRSGPAGTGRR